jgi:hypothetical protein
MLVVIMQLTWDFQWLVKKSNNLLQHLELKLKFMRFHTKDQDLTYAGGMIA